MVNIILMIAAILLSPLNTFAQSLWSRDTASERVMQNECDDKVFTKVENTASLNIPATDFGDTLYSFLKSKKVFLDKTKIKFRFIVTTRSQIFDITKESGEFRKEGIVKEALLKFSSYWNPATQNGHKVCSYVRFEMSIKDEKLQIAITQ